MTKRHKPGKYKKKKTEPVKVYTYQEYIEAIKALKKFSDSIDYLKLYYDSIIKEGEDDTLSNWKFKSNLQTFLKKHILIKDIYGKDAFSHFQYYLEKMSGKETFLKTCQDIIEKIQNKNTAGILEDLLIYNVKPMTIEESERFFDKLLKRCVILIENN